MTIEAHNAVKAGYQFECKKDAMRQNQDGSWKATLNIHPDEMNSKFLSDAMGQRYMCVMVPIDDNEEPRVTPKEDKPKSFAGQAKMMAQEPAFVRFMNTRNSEEAEILMKTDLSIKSCSELLEGTPAGYSLKRLQGGYLRWKEQEKVYGGREW